MSGPDSSWNTARQRRRKDPIEQSPVKVGDLVADKYRVEQVIAAGGMGVVVAARHEALGQRYAIKFLLPDVEDPQYVERFLREGRAAARIESSHICRVFDCGSLPSGVPYMVMEYLSGHDLAHELKSRGRLDLDEAIDVLLQAIEGIAEAHALGVIHRDLKPANLFLCSKPGRPREVKVLDFGISKVTADLSSDIADDLTATRAMLGSPRYMSPEQVQASRFVDARTDIWSLGIILFEMLGGKPPFSGRSMGEVIGKVITGPIPRLDQIRPDVPMALVAVVERCLERDRERRFPNVAELARALVPFAKKSAQDDVERIAMMMGAPPPSAAPYARPRPAGDDASIGTVGAFTNSPTEARRRRTAAIGIGLLLVAGLAAGAVIILQKRNAPKSEPAATAPSVAASAPAAPLPEKSETPRIEVAPPSASAPPPSSAQKPVEKPRPRRKGVDLDESY